MNIYIKIIKEICAELGIKCNFISKDWIAILEYNNTIKTIAGYKFDNNPYALGTLFDDKAATYEYLKFLNIPVVNHTIIYANENKEDYAKDTKGNLYLKKLFKLYNENVVLKINNGTCGNNVYHISSYEELETTYQSLSKKHHALSVCPYLEILNEYRAIVLNKKVVLLYKKIRPVIVGDGIHTIKELLIEFNPEYFKDYDKENKNQILNSSQKYTYDWRFNLSKGAKMSFDIDEETKKNVLNIVEQALKTNIQFGSIDIVKTINNEYFVLEINSGVMMANLIKENKDGYDIAKEIYRQAIKNLFDLK